MALRPLVGALPKVEHVDAVGRQVYLDEHGSVVLTFRTHEEAKAFLNLLRYRASLDAAKGVNNGL